MTRDELKKKVEFYSFDEIDTNVIMTAVDTYTSAITAQSSCSKLRELLEQRLKQLQKRHFRFGNIYDPRSDTEEKTIQWVMELIKELSPVA